MKRLRQPRSQQAKGHTPSRFPWVWSVRDLMGGPSRNADKGAIVHVHPLQLRHSRGEGVKATGLHGSSALRSCNLRYPL